MRKLFVSAFALLPIFSVHAEPVDDSLITMQDTIAPEETQVTDKALAHSEKGTAVEEAEQKSDIPAPESKKTPKAEETEGSSKLPVIEEVENTDKPEVKKESTSEEVSELPAIEEDVKSEPETKAPEATHSAQPAEKQEQVETGALKLKEVNSVDFFRNPNAFVSVLAPGYWHVVPHADGDGWGGELLVTRKILLAILNGDLEYLAGHLLNVPGDSVEARAFRRAATYAIEGLLQLDESARQILEDVRLSEITSYSEYLRNHGLERFDHGDEVFERQLTGIPVRYADNGRVVIDFEALGKLFAERFKVVAEIKEIQGQIDAISTERAGMMEAFSEEVQAKLDEIQRLSAENAELQKKIDAEKSKNANEIAKLEAELVAAQEELKKAEEMPETVSTRRGRGTTQNPERQPAIDASNKKIEEIKAKLKELTAGYAEFESKRAANEARISEIKQDENVEELMAVERTINRKTSKKLEKVKDDFDRLSVLDPSKITATELKAKKISKEVRDQVEELERLKKQNVELKEKIDAEKAKNNKDIEKAEEEKAAAIEKLKKAKEMPETVSTRRGRGTTQNPERQPAIDAATKEIADAETKLKDLTAGYAEFEKQYNENEARRSELKTKKEVIAAKKILDALEAEKRAKAE